MTWCRACFMLSTRMKEPANVCRSLAWEVATSGRDFGSEKKKIGIWVFLAVEIKHGLIKTLRGGTRIRGIMTTSGHLHCKNTFKTLEDKLMVHIFGSDTFVCRKP